MKIGTKCIEMAFALNFAEFCTHLPHKFRIRHRQCERTSDQVRRGLSYLFIVNVKRPWPFLSVCRANQKEPGSWHSFWTAQTSLVIITPQLCIAQIRKPDGCARNEARDCESGLKSSWPQGYWITGPLRWLILGCCPARNAWVHVGHALLTTDDHLGEFTL
jgi:hypothetical protein